MDSVSFTIKTPFRTSEDFTSTHLRYMKLWNWLFSCTLHFSKLGSFNKASSFAVFLFFWGGDNACPISLDAPKL